MAERLLGHPRVRRLVPDVLREPGDGADLRRRTTGGVAVHVGHHHGVPTLDEQRRDGPPDARDLPR